jgi:uncharacterized repeat protein (TIGR01451 family)
VSPSAAGNLAVTATVAAPPGVVDATGNNTATDTDTLDVQADLAITKTDGKDSVLPGSSVTYTITVTNNGPSAVQSLTVTDTLPPLLQIPIVFTPAQGVYNETTGLWTGLNLLPGQSVSLTLTGTVDLSLTGNLVNTVTVSPPAGAIDPVSGNNTATDTDFSGPNMTLIKAVDHTSAAPGTELIYSVHYHNTGGSEAKNLIVLDTVPDNTTYVTGSLRIGDAVSTYDTAATHPTDATGDDAGEISGTNITFIIPSVAKDDGTPNSGIDEGILYYKVKIN